MYFLVILIFVIILTILEQFFIKDKSVELVKMNYNDKYTKCEYLLSKNELKFYRIIKQITDKLGYSLFCQVSLYQIVKNKDFRDFNKIKSKSIDFVITKENCKILLCIELDDRSHERSNRIKRDKFIDNLFKEVGIKLLRVPVQSFYNLEELETKIKEV